MKYIKYRKYRKITTVLRILNVSGTLGILLITIIELLDDIKSIYELKEFYIFCFVLNVFIQILKKKEETYKLMGYSKENCILWDNYTNEEVSIKWNQITEWKCKKTVKYDNDLSSEYGGSTATYYEIIVKIKGRKNEIKIKNFSKYKIDNDFDYNIIKVKRILKKYAKNSYKKTKTIHRV